MQVNTQNITVPKLRFKELDDSWKTIRFDSVADENVKWSITGGPFGSDLKSEDYTETGVRIIQLQNIGDGFFNEKNKIYTSEEKADSLIACNIFAGEIIISKMGDPVARACIMPYEDDRYLMSSDGIRFVPNKNKFDKHFIFQSINLPSYRKQAISLSTGSTRKRIGLTDLKKTSFLIPSLPEQEKIASFLSSVDERIQKLERKKTLLEDYKKGVMQKIFSQELRFKNEQGNSYPEWEEKMLGEVFEIKSGKSKSKYITENGKNIIVDMGAISRIPSLVANKRTNFNTDFLTTNDLVMPKDDIGGGLIIGKVVEIPENGKYIFGDHIYILTYKMGYILYLKYAINSYYVNKSFRQKANGTAQIGLNRKTVETQYIQFPIIEEQQKIASFLSGIDKKIELVETQIQQSKTFKKGLLQQMFV